MGRAERLDTPGIIMVTGTQCIPYFWRLELGPRRNLVAIIDPTTLSRGCHVSCLKKKILTRVNPGKSIGFRDHFPVVCPQLSTSGVRDSPYITRQPMSQIKGFGKCRHSRDYSSQRGYHLRSRGTSGYHLAAVEPPPRVRVCFHNAGPGPGLEYRLESAIKTGVIQHH